MKSINNILPPLNPDWTHFNPSSHPSYLSPDQDQRTDHGWRSMDQPGNKQCMDLLESNFGNGLGYCGKSEEGWPHPNTTNFWTSSTKNELVELRKRPKDDQFQRNYCNRMKRMFEKVLSTRLEIKHWWQKFIEKNYKHRNSGRRNCTRDGWSSNSICVTVAWMATVRLER